MLGYLARDGRLGRRREVRRGRISSSTPIAYVLGAIVDRGGKCEEETRRAAPLNRFRGGFSVPRLLAPLLKKAVCASTYERFALEAGALALAFASQTVTPPSETPWHSTYVLVEKRPFRSSTSTRRPWPSAPDGTTHSLSPWSAMR